MNNIVYAFGEGVCPGSLDSWSSWKAKPLLIMDELFDVFDEGDGGASAGGVSDSAAAAAATEAALAAARASVPTYTPAAEPKAAKVESADTRCVWVAAAVEVQRRASPLWPLPCISGVLVGMCLQHAVGVRMALNTATVGLVSH